MKAGYFWYCDTGTKGTFRSLSPEEVNMGRKQQHSGHQQHSARSGTQPITTQDFTQVLMSSLVCQGATEPLTAGPRQCSGPQGAHL